MQQRARKLWQIALTVLLFRYQRTMRSHFDLEHPPGSALMKIRHVPCGNLKTHDSQKPIRKRMAVCSTFTSILVHVVIALHGKLCHGNHHHQQKAGITKVQGKTMQLSQWAELCPQKIAKQGAKFMLHDKVQLCPPFAGEVNEHPTKKLRLGH